LHEKSGKRHEVPAHHNAEAYMDAYIEKAGISEEKKTPLFNLSGRIPSCRAAAMAPADHESRKLRVVQEATA
jgi:hypothetical protein